MSRQCTDCKHGDTTEIWCADHGHTVNKAAARLCDDFEVARVDTSNTRHVTGCNSKNDSCPFCQYISSSGQTWCRLDDGEIKDAEEMVGKAPSWCPLRNGPVTVCIASVVPTKE